MIDRDKNNLKSKDVNGYSIKNIKLNGRDAKKISYIEKLKNGKYYTKRIYYVTLEDGIVFKGALILILINIMRVLIQYMKLLWRVASICRDPRANMFAFI